MESNLDWEKFRWSEDAQARLAAAGARRHTKRRRAKGELFLKGPVPWPWLSAAAQLPGKCLHVAIVAWFQTDLRRSDRAKLSRSAAAELGVGQESLRESLNRLENAGLLIVKRRAGQSPEIRIPGKSPHTER